MHWLRVWSLLSIVPVNLAFFCSHGGHVSVLEVVHVMIEVNFVLLPSVRWRVGVSDCSRRSHARSVVRLTAWNICFGL